MSNRAALTELRTWVKRMRALGDLGELAAPGVGIALGQELRRTISESEEPSGKPWKRTREGDAPLTGAMQAVKVHVQGAKVTVVVSGPEGWHHTGFARGGVQRKVIPTTRRLPPAYAQAMSRAISQTFTRIMSGDLK